MRVHVLHGGGRGGSYLYCADMKSPSRRRTAVVWLITRGGAVWRIAPVRVLSTTTWSALSTSQTPRRSGAGNSAVKSLAVDGSGWEGWAPEVLRKMDRAVGYCYTYGQASN